MISVVVVDRSSTPEAVVASANGLPLRGSIGSSIVAGYVPVASA